MADETTIPYCDYTWSPWWGCTKISAGCANCYADRLSRRWHSGQGFWGDSNPRKMMSLAHWKNPHNWNNRARRTGTRRRVLVSMCDPFEDRLDLTDARRKFFTLIEGTAWLDWLVLTKRPQNIQAMVPKWWASSWPANVWIGTSIENQKTADERIGHLQAVPSLIRWLSIEPALELIDFTYWIDLDRSEGRNGKFIEWAVIGGESGPSARKCAVEWIRGMKQQLQAAGVPVYVKQLGAYPVTNETDPTRTPDIHQITVNSRKGEQPKDWPADLQVRELPLEPGTVLNASEG